MRSRVLRIANVVALLILANSSITSAHAENSTATRNAKPVAGPCETLNAGGTVYDSHQCEELAATGATLSKAKTGKITVITVAGTKSDWQVFSKSTHRRVAGRPIVLRNKANHSVVAKTSSDDSGRFTLVIPANMEGDFELVPLPQNSQTAGGDNEGFCYRILPSDHFTLSEICAEDAEFPGMSLRAVKAKVGTAATVLQKQKQ